MRVITLLTIIVGLSACSESPKKSYEERVKDGRSYQQHCEDAGGRFEKYKIGPHCHFIPDWY